MLIDFSTLEEQKIPCFRGGEKVTTARMFVDPLVKIMSGHLEPGASIGMHKGHTHSLINDSDAGLTFLAVIPEQP